MGSDCISSSSLLIFLLSLYKHISSVDHYIYLVKYLTISLNDFCKKARFVFTNVRALICFSD